MSIRTSVRLPAGSRRGHARSVPERSHPVGDGKIVALRLASGAIVLWGLVSLIGVLLTHILITGSVHSADLGVDRWFAVHRTGLWNTITSDGESVAQTYTAIAVTVVVALFLRWRMRRWYESWVLVTVMAGELLLFIAVTFTIHRHRPPVARLDVASSCSLGGSGYLCHSGSVVADLAGGALAH